MMSGSLLSKRHFVCTDLEKNSNKAWIIELFDIATTRVTYGRVGAKMAIEDKTHDNQSAAEKYFDSRVKDKQRVKTRRDAYTEIQVIESNTVLRTDDAGKNHGIEEIALREIKTNVPEFIRWLCRINVHNITQNTQIKYDIKDGSFRTPLGVLDKSCLVIARELLDKIAVYVNNNDLENKAVIPLLNKYLRFLPQDLGSSHIKIQVKNIFPDIQSLQKQSAIIDSLEASITNAKSVDDVPKSQIFNTVLEEVDQSEIKEMYNRKYPSINKVYFIKVNSVDNAFKIVSSKYGNIQRRWHGSNPANALSIIKNGLIIPHKPVNGWVHGRGIYTAVKVDTSLGYSSVNEGKQLLFITDVALGNYKTSGMCTDKDDSLFLGDYTIVPRCEQVNLLFLVEFA